MEFFNKWSVIFIDRLMKDFDLDLLSAVSIIGNAGHESGGFKQLQELKPLVAGSKGGWGIMQWTGPRRREAEAYWKRNNLSPTDMDANYKFLFVELRGPEGRVLSKLKQATTLEQKTKVFSETFLRPGIPHMDARYTWSKRALDAWNKQPQKPVESVPTSVVVDDTPWWLKLLLRLLRGK
jgi:hypothetical protein